MRMLVNSIPILIVFLSLVFPPGSNAQEGIIPPPGIQVIVEPSQLLLGIGERDWIGVTVVDAAGRPLAGVTLSVQSDRADILSVSKEGLFVTDNYGHISFSALGRQTGGCNINIFDGLNTVRINTVVKELRRYVLTFYYGNSEIQLVNPTEVTNFIKIKFYPDEGQAYPPMYLTLLEKQRKKVVLSEQYGEPLPYGWVEVMSTQELLGGLWTNKGYLPLYESK